MMTPKAKAAVAMPKYGFGDPKSYAIMKFAVQRLEDSGAVRHGAECFNFYFPQELDDEFLGKSALVLFYYVNLLVQYDVSVMCLLHLVLVHLYLTAFKPRILTNVTIISLHLCKS